MRHNTMVVLFSIAEIRYAAILCDISFAQLTLDMPALTIPSMDLESTIVSFRAGASVSGEALLLPNWSDQDWKQLFQFTSIRRVMPGDALIRQGEPDRTLYFVLRGKLEIIVRSGDGISMGRAALVGAGSVLGELAFFDGGPRSAGAWAVDDCDVATMTPDQYSAFEKISPALARELLFALGRILALRLRRTNERLVR
jgi:CRP/FNR family cyclic AMP-dependent transcriptional regulator